MYVHENNLMKHHIHIIT